MVFSCWIVVLDHYIYAILSVPAKVCLSICVAKYSSEILKEEKLRWTCEVKLVENAPINQEPRLKEQSMLAAKLA